MYLQEKNPGQEGKIINTLYNTYLRLYPHEDHKNILTPVIQLGSYMAHYYDLFDLHDSKENYMTAYKIVCMVDKMESSSIGHALKEAHHLHQEKKNLFYYLNP